MRGKRHLGSGGKLDQIASLQLMDIAGLVGDRHFAFKHELELVELVGG